MGNSCRLRERTSPFYKGLLDYTGNRKVTNVLYSLKDIPEIMKSLQGIEFEGGEPTASSFLNAINIDDILETPESVKKVLIKNNLLDKKGNLKEMSLHEAVETSIEINSESEKVVAVPHKKDATTAVISVQEKTAEVSELPQKLSFSSELNNRLLGIMREAGFDFAIDNAIEHGIFDPTNATKTAEGLLTVIRIAKGRIGEEAFPEEFSHLMIDALHNTTLVTRFLNVLDEEAITEILGESYEAYNKKYKGDFSRLRREAAGRLLQSHITKTDEFENTPKSLLSRIWNMIKSLFSKISENEVKNSIQEANDLAGRLSEFIQTEDIVPLIDKKYVLESSSLYSLGEEVNKEKEIADKALEVLARRMNILRTRSKSGDYTPEDMNAMNTMKESIEKKQYVSSYYFFLQESLVQIEQLQRQMDRLLSSDVRDASDLTKIRSLSITLRNLNEFIEGYSPIINTLRRLDVLKEEGSIDIDNSDIENLNSKAIAVSEIINKLKSQSRNMRFNVVYNYLKLFWGEDKIVSIGKNKGNKITLKHILEIADKDINGVDRWIGSLSESSDILSNLIDKAVKTQQNERDYILNRMFPEIRAAHKTLIDAGETTDFMYERDEKGNLTGRIISDIDFIKFKKERDAYIDSLKKEKASRNTIKYKLIAWDRAHTEKVFYDKEALYFEVLPKKSLYGKDVISKLNETQREYYDFMINLKRNLDSFLPKSYVNTYNAVQIRKDLTESITTGTSPQELAKATLNRIKDNFIIREDDTEFGERGNVILDFAGNEVNKLPVYYTTPIKDPNDLSTDFTSSIMAYSTMAVNYNEMSKVIDVLELTKDLIHDREVKQTRGNKVEQEVFKVLGNIFKKEKTKSGDTSSIAARIDDYYNMVLYQKTKEEQTVTLFEKEIPLHKLMDNVKEYTSMVGLGWNPFSGLSNVLMGKLQIFIEACCGQYFTYKDSVKAKAEYWKMMPAYIAEINSSTKTNKLSLLIDKYDALGEFFNSQKYNKLRQGPLARIFGNTNMYLLQTGGEQYLHARTMLSMLVHQQVVVNGKQMSLLDAYDVKEIKDKNGNTVAAELVLPENIKTIEGENFTKELDFDLKNTIRRVNQSLNGAFNEEDRGAINKKWQGRLILNFRQWMPEHYLRRFSGTYYDAQTGEFREGYYKTFVEFGFGLLKDLARGKGELIAHWNSLSEVEKANVHRALAEIGTFASLSFSVLAMGKVKDHKHKWLRRMIQYQLMRLKLETGASVPSFQFITNAVTLTKTPAAAINSVDNVMDIVDLSNMFIEIESGRFKGWSKWEKAVYKATPVVPQVQKAFDLAEEDYMFAIFKNT